MSSTENKAILQTPLGALMAVVKNNELTSLNFTTEEAHFESNHALFADLQKELNAYFSGDLKKFSIPLNPEGTSFQRRVWAKLRRIPFGARISYLEFAELYGDKKAIRAVASANGANPIAILIPCHRIIGRDGDLTGYAWGLDRKKSLLQHEMKFTPQHDLFG